MEPLFFLIRLPFFAIGIVLCIDWDILRFPVIVMAYTAWIVWVVATRLLGFPFRLIGASWKNDASVLTSGLEEKFEQVSSSWTSIFSDYFANMRHLYEWQMNGSK